MSETPDDALSRLITGSLALQLVYVAAKLRIPDLLEDAPKSAEELTRLTNAHPDFLPRLLRGLVWCGILTEDAEKRYALTPVGDGLREDAPNSQRYAALIMGECFYRAYAGLLENVRTGETAFHAAYGTTLFDFLSAKPEVGEVFQRFMREGTVGISSVVGDLYDFSRFQKVVDVGGGYGHLLAEILKANPRLSGVVYDLPSVVEGTKRTLDSQGLAGRCEAIGGDFFRSVPVGGDAYLLKWILHDWNDERCRRILTNIREAMKPDGKLLVLERILSERAEAGAPEIRGDLQMMTLCGGMERTERHFRELFASAGFALERILDTGFPMKILELQISGA